MLVKTVKEITVTNNFCTSL